MDLEYKSIPLEVKEINDQGVYVGLASPYGNIDDGGDEVQSSIGPLNDGKSVPILYQHDTTKVLGSQTLKNTKAGIQTTGQLILDKDKDGQYMVPLAAEAYTLLKKGLLKLSIGYRTLDYEYAVKNGQNVRLLKNIDICEVSLVTFPMNSNAVVSNVKSNIENKEGENQMENKEQKNNTEQKAMGFAQILKLQQAQNMRWRLQDALNDSFRQLMNDDAMKIEDKVTQLNTNVDDFAKSYKEIMAQLLQASAQSKTAKKEIEKSLETKSNDSNLETKDNQEQQETKSGKKISKANKDKISQCKDALTNVATLIASLLEDDTPDDSSGDDPDSDIDDEDKSKKKPSTPQQKKPKDGEGTPPDDGKDPNKQKKSNGSNLEWKSEEIEALKKLHSSFNEK